MKNNDYEVGRGKPPKDFQFKKGVSGNPKGRPKGSVNLHTLVLRAGAKLVVVTEGGKKRTIPKSQMVIEQTVNQAASGNRAAARDWFKLQRDAEAEEANEAGKKMRDPAAERRRLELIMGYKERNATSIEAKDTQGVDDTPQDFPDEEWPINVIR